MPHKIDKPESYVSKFLKSPVFLLGFACTGVAVAALLTWAMKFMSPDHLMLGLGVTFCLMCVIIFFTTYLNRIRNVDLLEDKLSTVFPSGVNKTDVIRPSDPKPCATVSDCTSPS